MNTLTAIASVEGNTMRNNQIYVNGIITNQGVKLAPLYAVRSNIITFTLELITLALLLAVLVALAIVIQPI